MTLSSDSSLRFRKNLLTIIEKGKTTHNNTEQNKAKNHLDGQTAIISILSSENVGKYEFLAGKDVLLEKD